MVVKNKHVELLLTLKEAWWLCFLQSRAQMEKNKSNKKR
jgi:hypothetical protein